MSDSSQGPGWWIASDGKWYAPELHPDARAAAEASAAEQTMEAEEVSVEDSTESPVATEEHEATDGDGLAEEAESETTEAEDEPVDATDAPVETVDESSDEAIETGEATTEQPVVAGSEVSEDAPTQTSAPVYLSAATAATPPAARQPWTPTSYSQPVATVEGPPVEGEVSAEEETPVVTATTNIVAGLIALVAAALIVVGSFLPWGEATGLLSGTVDGFDSNGIGTLVAGVVLAASAGLLLAGVRHILMLVAVLGASLVTIGLAVYSMFDITGSASDNLVDEVIEVTGRDALEVAASGTGLDIGYGLWMVLAGGAVGLISAMFVRFNE